MVKVFVNITVLNIFLIILLIVGIIGISLSLFIIEFCLGITFSIFESTFILIALVDRHVIITTYEEKMYLQHLEWSNFDLLATNKNYN